MENAILATPLVLLAIVFSAVIFWKIARVLIRTTMFFVVTASLVALLVVGYLWSPAGQAQSKRIAADWFEQTY